MQTQNEQRVPYLSSHDVIFFTALTISDIAGSMNNGILCSGFVLCCSALSNVEASCIPPLCNFESRLFNSALISLARDKVLHPKRNANDCTVSESSS